MSTSTMSGGRCLRSSKIDLLAARSPGARAKTTLLLYGPKPPRWLAAVCRPPARYKALSCRGRNSLRSQALEQSPGLSEVYPTAWPDRPEPDYSGNVNDPRCLRAGRRHRKYNTRRHSKRPSPCRSSRLHEPINTAAFLEPPAHFILDNLSTHKPRTRIGSRPSLREISFTTPTSASQPCRWYGSRLAGTAAEPALPVTTLDQLLSSISMPTSKPYHVRS